MRDLSSVSCVLAGWLLVGFISIGCVFARLPEGSAAYVHVTANGVITFWGEPVSLNALADTISRAGATRETLIRIVPQGQVSDRLIRSIAGSLGRGGFRRVVIMEQRKAVVIVDGKTQSEVPTDDALHQTPETAPAAQP